MSGLIGVSGKINEELMIKALENMYHRGPDDAYSKITDNYHLGYCHLAISNENGETQPISDKNKTSWLICDGEIFNFDELRTQMPNLVLKTNLSSEIILHVYQQFGTKGFQMLDGMFAFIIADEKNKNIIACRDPLGIKPLYYGKCSNGELVFSSELKTIYLITEEVFEFPVGHYYLSTEGFVEYRKIEVPEENEYFSENKIDNLHKKIRDKVEEAVCRHLNPHVDLGVLLSGGLDSSLIAAITSKYFAKQIPSFAVGSSQSLDIPAAYEVAKAIGSKHYEYVYTEKELIKALPDVIYYLESYDPSLVRSAIPTYFVSRLASQYVKVVLSGEGADELFSGYSYLKSITNSEKLNAELLTILTKAHNINLQRVDRMTMAHSVEARMPFLDLELIDFTMKIPASLKLRGKEKMEKWILRESFSGVLPESILWRTKAEFSEGSGALDILEKYAEEQISERDFANMKKSEDVKLRSKQEVLYYQIFKEFYPQVSAQKTVGHWITT